YMHCLVTLDAANIQYGHWNGSCGKPLGGNTSGIVFVEHNLVESLYCLNIYTQVKNSVEKNWRKLIVHRKLT
ncbi:hypothetical protein ACJX0J_028943, partial [Zea mays]